MVARAANDGATYCCGVTLEVFVRAWRRVDPALTGLDPDDADGLVAEWFCPVIGHPGAAAALAERGLGVPVADEDAQPGDLCQFWRRTRLDAPSGHSVVFLGWEADGDGARRMRYFSSQPATSGVGVHAETVGPEWEIHLARPRLRQ